MYSVGQIKEITGVSARTLQYYDEIGLLKPTVLTEAKYRKYDDTALQKLQQVLFLKELGFSLLEIKEMLANPAFDKADAYKRQRELLLLKRNRTDRLIQLLDRLERGEQCMSFKEFDLTEYIQALEVFKRENKEAVCRYWGSTENFDSFLRKVKENEDEVAKLAIRQFGSVEKYTEAMQQNMARFDEVIESKVTEDVRLVGERSDAMYQRLTADLTLDCSDEEVQALVKELIDLMAQNSDGASRSNTCQTVIEAYSNEFIREVTNKKYGVGAAEFIVNAFRCYKERIV